MNFSWFNRKFLAILLPFFLSLMTLSTPIYAGSIINHGAGGEPATWFIGETPEVVDDNKPVILFVQGINSSASAWYENNDMYLTAYQNGYETVFVELYDSAGTSMSMWDNGRLLAEMIEEIHQHFGKKLVLVTHSKGGIDAQTAVVHYQAYPYVSNVITLGSPHYGSELADLAYSSWAGWLAAILGQRSEGLYSLQTGYMEYFRSITDHHVNVAQNSYYTLAGTKWGSFGSLLYWSGLYLSQFGSSDGVVVVNRANLPTGTMLRVGNWNHYEIKYGSQTFAWFSPYLISSLTTKLTTQEAFLKPTGNDFSTEMNETNQFVRGGEFVSEVIPSFFVEEGVKRITIDFVSAYPLDEIQLVGSQGEEKFEIFQDTSYFNQAWHHLLEIKNPQQGEWRLQAKSTDKNAYLLHVQLESKLSQALQLQKSSTIHSKKQYIQLHVDQQLVKDQKVKLSYQVDFIADGLTHAPAQNTRQVQPPQRVIEESKNVKENALLMYTKDSQSGIYNITIDVQGETLQGNPFERTMIQSIYIDHQGQSFSSLQ